MRSAGQGGWWAAMKCLLVAIFVMLSAFIPRMATGQDGGWITQPDVSAERSHSCGVTTAGVAYCWGGTQSRDADGQIPAGGGQLGDGTNTASNVPVAVAGGLTFQSVSADLFHGCGVTSAGVAYCWGLEQLRPARGRYGHGQQRAGGGLGRAHLPVDERRRRSQLRDDDCRGRYCWGYNGRGWLG